MNENKNYNKINNNFILLKKSNFLIPSHFENRSENVNNKENPDLSSNKQLSTIHNKSHIQDQHPINKTNQIPISQNRLAIYNAISGAAAGTANSLLLCPLDVIKTRLQIQRTAFNDHPKYTSLAKTFATMYKEEGLLSFYRGLNTTLVGLVSTWMIYFCLYDSIKNFISKTLSIQPHSTSSVLISSVASGAITSTVISPLWVVRTRIQAHVGSSSKYPSIYSALMKIIHKEGVSALYSGLVPSYLGLFHVAVQFTLYEKFKTFFKKQNLKSKGEVVNMMTMTSVPMSTSQILISSIVSRICASIIAYPHEILRSRLQNSGHSKSLNPTKYYGLISTAKTIFREEGIRSFYKGLTPNLLRITPAAAITFLTYEYTLDKLKNDFSS